MRCLLRVFLPVSLLPSPSYAGMFAVTEMNSATIAVINSQGTRVWTYPGQDNSEGLAYIPAGASAGKLLLVDYPLLLRHGIIAATKTIGTSPPRQRLRSSRDTGHVPQARGGQFKSTDSSFFARWQVINPTSHNAVLPTDQFANPRNPDKCCGFNYPQQHQPIIMATKSGASYRSERVASGGILHDRQDPWPL